MNWLTLLHQTQPVAHAILALSCVAFTGLALGAIRYRGIALGTAGVLFTGIFFGHLGNAVNHEVLDWVKEFGLVLFVFTIGLQLGPGFVAALRQQGLKLNLLAAAIVFGGAMVTVVMARMLKVDSAAVAGLFAGATTNTPSLGAAQQALATFPDFPADRAALPALAYAVAYPVGIIGIIGSLLGLRILYRINPAREAEQFRAEQQRGIEPIERATVRVENRQIDGMQLGNIPAFRDGAVVVSRFRSEPAGVVRAATDQTVIHIGDLLLAVGTRRSLQDFATAVGPFSEVDLSKLSGQVISRRFIVSRKAVLGKTVDELGLDHRHGVTITRVIRGDLEMTAVPDLRLRFGDLVQAVGEEKSIAAAAKEVGDSVKAMNETQFIPLFLGIAIGIVVGLIPITFPGLPVPVRLGLAGGPLIVGILLSRLGHIAKLVWYMPLNANLAFRELGITLFLAAVGLKAGEKFFTTVFSSAGPLWLACALLTAVVPLMLVGIFARSVLKLNYTTISGLIAGSTTDPPALAFAGMLARSDGPYVAYATVYPLTMLLRIVTAQALALLLVR